MTTDSPEPEIGPEAKFRPNILLQWFVFPMLAVVLCVGLYLSFRFLTSENKTSADYLNDLRSGNPHRAWQAAFALANQVNLDRLTEMEKPAVGKTILEMLEQSSPGAGEIRQYFILTLGRLRHREAIPRLTGLVGGTDSAEKIYALLALREMRASEAIESASAALEDRDAGVRKTAAYFFGALAKSSPDLASRLHPTLNDPVPDVRWNAGLSLAEFGDPAALPVLHILLDRQALTEQMKTGGGLDEMNLEKIIKAALSASAHFRDSGLEGTIQKLAESDPQVSVQVAAKQTLEQMKRAR